MTSPESGSSNRKEVNGDSVTSNDFEQLQKETDTSFEDLFNEVNGNFDEGIEFHNDASFGDLEEDITRKIDGLIEGPMTNHEAMAREVEAIREEKVGEVIAARKETEDKFVQIHDDVVSQFNDIDRHDAEALGVFGEDITKQAEAKDVEVGDAEVYVSRSEKVVNVLRHAFPKTTAKVETFFANAKDKWEHGGKVAFQKKATQLAACVAICATAASAFAGCKRGGKEDETGPDETTTEVVTQDDEKEQNKEELTDYEKKLVEAAKNDPGLLEGCIEYDNNGRIVPNPDKKNALDMSAPSTFDAEHATEDMKQKFSKEKFLESANTKLTLAAMFDGPNSWVISGEPAYQNFVKKNGRGPNVNEVTYMLIHDSAFNSSVVKKLERIAEQATYDVRKGTDRDDRDYVNTGLGLKEVVEPGGEKSLMFAATKYRQVKIEGRWLIVVTSGKFRILLELGCGGGGVNQIASPVDNNTMDAGNWTPGPLRDFKLKADSAFVGSKENGYPYGKADEKNVDNDVNTDKIVLSDGTVVNVSEKQQQAMSDEEKKKEAEQDEQNTKNKIPPKIIDPGTGKEVSADEAVEVGSGVIKGSDKSTEEEAEIETYVEQTEQQSEANKNITDEEFREYF